MLHLLEQIVGLLIMLFVLADVFLTVLYARIGTGGVARFGTGVISDLVARYVWQLFRHVATRGSRTRANLLSFAAPVILVVFVLVWAALLVLGAAMILHPKLGTSVRTSGKTPTDFISAIYAAGSSISVVSASDYSPKTPAFRLIYTINSFIGLSVLSLTITYLLQIYSALQRRNTLGYKLEVMAGGTGDAAELVAGLGEQGHLGTGYTQLAELGAEIANQKETYQFYSMLFYFRYRETCYATSRMALVLLDAVSLIQSAIGEGEHEWLKRMAATKQIWLATMGLVTTLEGAFVPGRSGDHARATPDAHTLERWRWRYLAAVRRFDAAGIETAQDRERGFREYVALRVRWQSYIDSLCTYMAHDALDIDPEGQEPPAPPAPSA